MSGSLGSTNKTLRNIDKTRTSSHTWKLELSVSIKASHSGVPNEGMSLETTMAICLVGKKRERES